MHKRNDDEAGIASKLETDKSHRNRAEACSEDSGVEVDLVDDGDARRDGKKAIVRVRHGFRYIVRVSCEV